jgi:TonB-linked SusC/RagA family outer membrane protein
MKKNALVASILLAMRISITQLILSAVFACSVYANKTTAQEILNKPVSVSVEKMELREVFGLLQRQTRANFIYSSNLIGADRRISVSVHQVKLADVLETVLKPLHIGYHVDDNKIILFTVSHGDELPAEERDISSPERGAIKKLRVSGTVVNDKNEPLSGVSIVLKGSSSGTSTDVNGKFALEVEEGANVVLIFSYTGFQVQEYPLNRDNTENLLIRLVSSNKELTDVVVIGYGSRKKSDITSAVSNINSDEIGKSVSMSPELAIQGRMTGVQVTTPGGSPFNRPVVRIRGQSTFGLGISDPLYVVDGIPLYEGNAGYDGTPQSRNSDLRGNVNVLSMFNPGDIESISVLKDAAATAVYGARAGNGVVLITTKKGKRGAPRVEFNAQAGVQNAVKKYSVINTTEYAKLAQEALANSGVTDPIDPYFDPSNPLYVGNKTNYDWQDALLQKNAHVQDYSVRVSGATDATNYYFSGGYSNTQGTINMQTQERYTFTTNITTRINKYINTGITYRGVYQRARDNANSDIATASRTVPWQPIYDTNGPFGFARSTYQKFVPNPNYGQPGNTIQPLYNLGADSLLYGPKPFNNFVALEALNDVRYSLNRNMGNAFVELQPVTGLKIRGSLSVDYTTNVRKEWQDFNTYQFVSTPQNPYAAQDGYSQGQYRNVSQSTPNIVKDISLNYAKTFGEHNFDVLLDASEQKATYNYSNLQVYQIPSRDPNRRDIYPSNTDPRSMQSESGREDNAIIGYLGRLSYHFSDRYYADVTIRRDGSSRFAEGHKWGTFPGASVAWRISKERFFEHIYLVNDLKLRGSYGTVGNQESRSSYPYLSTVSNYPWYSFGSGNGNGTGNLATTAVLNDFPNNGLTWEKNTTADAGFDLIMLNNRLNVTFDYYNKTTKGILQYTNLPLSVGSVNQALTNIANVRNSGIELSVGYSDHIGAFQYNVSANITTVSNKVLKVYNPVKGAGTNNIDTGQSIGFIYGPKIAGIFQNQKQIDDFKSKVTYDEGFQTQKYTTGDLYFADANGDGRIDPKDYQVLGKTIAGYFYGLNLGGSYKGFDLSVLIQGVGDVQAYNAQRASGENLYADGSNAWSTVLERWTPAHTNTMIPKATRGDESNSNGRFSNRFVENAGYVRLKNVQVGYSVPYKVFKNALKGSMIRLFVAGTNLAVKTKYSGLDPEESVYEGSSVNPPARTFTFGINASF